VLARLGPAVVYVATDKGIGSAFHIGEGFFVTARHVVEDQKISEVGRFDLTQVVHFHTDGGTTTTTTWPEARSKNIEGVWVHPNDKVDLAVFLCREIKAPDIQLELRSDALAYNQFLLKQVLVLGYPPIPFSKAPQLVCVPTTVGAVIEHYFVGRRHFVLNAMARGGFSGGVALTLEFGAATLGVVTQSLGKDHEATELGYLAVLSAELVVEMLDAHRITTRTLEMTKRGFVVRR
jgi:hypothetical protein